MGIRVRRFLNKGKTSAPYLSGDAIADLVDYSPLGKNGEVTQPDLQVLSNANSIFIPGHLLSSFMNAFGHRVCAQTLVTGNSDQNFEVIPLIAPSIKLWIGQNIGIPEKSINSVEIRVLPIGLENLALGRAGRTKFLKNSVNLDSERVLVPPMAPSNPIRRRVNEIVKSSTGSFLVVDKYLEEKKYFELVSKFRFVLCLEGNGYENHRIWETLYRSSFPVMFKSTWSISLQELRLPIFYIDSLDECSQENLRKFAESNAAFEAKIHPELWTPYWHTLINGQKS